MLLQSFCVPYIFLFFFYCSGPLQDLHSFPTRRSSDLFSLLHSVSAYGGGGDIQKLNPFKRVTDKPVVFWSDRKSTRLNSSHVSISYAVFCLKKKKKYINITTVEKQ